MRELARRVGRDVKAVHNDVAVLVEAGVIDRTGQGKLLFPYHHVKVQFALDDDGLSPATPPTVAAPPVAVSQRLG